MRWQSVGSKGIPMNKPAFESRTRLQRMWSVRIQAIWAAACTVFVTLLPANQQAALLALVGITGEGGIAAVVFFAQLSIAVSAATIAARATKQAGLEA
jgi:hypothetical protein